MTYDIPRTLVLKYLKVRVGRDLKKVGSFISIIILELAVFRYNMSIFLLLYYKIIHILSIFC